MKAIFLTLALSIIIALNACTDIPVAPTNNDPSIPSFTTTTVQKDYGLEVNMEITNPTRCTYLLVPDADSTYVTIILHDNISGDYTYRYQGQWSRFFGNSDIAFEGKALFVFDIPTERLPKNLSSGTLTFTVQFKNCASVKENITPSTNIEKYNF